MYVIICSLREEPVKITKEVSRDKRQMRFNIFLVLNSVARIIICSLGEDPVKITKEVSRDKRR